MRPEDQVLWAAKELYRRGLNGLLDGNVSMRLGSTILITPSGLPKPLLTAEQLVEVDMEGRVVKGFLKPSSEVKMHLEVYKRSNGVRAVVHSHNPITVLLARLYGSRVGELLMEESVEVRHYVSNGIRFLDRKLPPGSVELAESVASLIRGPEQVVVIRDHGILVASSNLFKAVHIADMVERLSARLALAYLLRALSKR